MSEILQVPEQVLYTTRTRFRAFTFADMGLEVDEHDPRIDRAIAAASRLFDRETNRRFIPFVATIKHDYQSVRQVFFTHDLLSISAFSDASGSIPADRYYLYPLEAPQYNKPYMWLEMNVDYYLSYNTTKQQALTITGKWGYFEHKLNHGKKLNADVDDSETTIALSDALGVDPGTILLLDDEQVLVTAVENNDSLTVTRAFNGTTAAAHTAASTNVYQLLPDPQVEEAVSIISARILARGQSGFADRMGDPTMGFTYMKALPAEVFRAVQMLRRKVFPQVAPRG